MIETFNLTYLSLFPLGKSSSGKGMGIKMSNKLAKQEQSDHRLLAKADCFLQNLVDVAICIYMLLFIVVMPFYNEDGYNFIGTDKYAFLKTFSIGFAKIIIPLLGIYLMVHIIFRFQDKNTVNKRLLDIVKSFTVTDLCALSFAIVVVISYVSSSYQQEALWGTRGWYMGMVSQLVFVAVYFLISRFWKIRNWIPFLFLPVSGIVFLLGYINRFGIYPIQMAGASPSFISTIGNINWYCGYLVTVLFGGVALVWNGEKWKKWQQILLYFYVGIGFASLATQGSSSGVMTLFVILWVMFLLSATDYKTMHRFLVITLVLAGTSLITFGLRIMFPGTITYLEVTTDFLTLSPFPFLLAAVAAGLLLWISRSQNYPVKTMKLLSRITLVGAGAGILLFLALLISNSLVPGSIGPLSNIGVFRFTPDWGSNRGATWSAGVMCFAEQGFWKKLVGVGPDCMASYIYNHGGDRLLSLVRESFGDDRLTNAHNEWLTMLVNVGLLGMISYAGMLVSAIVRYLKQRKEFVVAGAAGLCVLAYSINNIVSFQQSMNAITVFIILGIGEAYLRNGRKMALESEAL